MNQLLSLSPSLPLVDDEYLTDNRQGRCQWKKKDRQLSLGTMEFDRRMEEQIFHDTIDTAQNQSMTVVKVKPKMIPKMKTGASSFILNHRVYYYYLYRGKHKSENITMIAPF